MIDRRVGSRATNGERTGSMGGTHSPITTLEDRGRGSGVVRVEW